MNHKLHVQNFIFLKGFLYLLLLNMFNEELRILATIDRRDKINDWESKRL